jgi:hypothetical protein
MQVIVDVHRDHLAQVLAQHQLQGMVVNFFFSIDSSLTWRNRKVPRGGDDRCASRMTMSLPPQRGGAFLLYLMLGDDEDVA